MQGERGWLGLGHLGVILPTSAGVTASLWVAFFFFFFGGFSDLVRSGLFHLPQKAAASQLGFLSLVLNSGKMLLHGSRGLKSTRGSALLF